jgi:hypothetical protein
VGLRTQQPSLRSASENPRRATGRRALLSPIFHLQSNAAWRATAEREAGLEVVTNDPLLPGRILPSDYPGQPAWRRRVEVLRDASRQLRTFKPE